VPPCHALRHQPDRERADRERFEIDQRHADRVAQGVIRRDFRQVRQGDEGVRQRHVLQVSELHGGMKLAHCEARLRQQVITHLDDDRPRQRCMRV
jgi:hypothetical protein